MRTGSDSTNKFPYQNGFPSSQRIWPKKIIGKVSMAADTHGGIPKLTKFARDTPTPASLMLATSSHSLRRHCEFNTLQQTVRALLLTLEWRRNSHRQALEHHGLNSGQSIIPNNRFIEQDQPR
jgi:hypothetical protein